MCWVCTAMAACGSREGSNCRHTGKGTLQPSGKAPLSCCRYVTVDEDAGRALYYVFQESLGKPDSDPLVLWLNGVGCACAVWHTLGANDMLQRMAMLCQPT